MGTLPRRLIAHLDMDAFYASVELLRRPDLKGLPVVIGGSRVSAEGAHTDVRLADYAGRGVVTTATYAARAFGVHSGMGIMKAAVLCPQAILLPVDFEAYRHWSRTFKAAVAEIAPEIEDRGIDEIYIDLSAVPGIWDAVGHDPMGGARAIAQEIKNNVQRATGLSCSVGLAANKLMAKIASDLDKPDGLTLLMAEDVPRRLWPLPVRRIHGVGPKSAERLTGLGITSIGDLASRELPWLIRHVGLHQAEWLHRAAQGMDDRPVVTHSEPVSMSRETTFGRDLHPQRDRAELGEIFTQLCRSVAADLQRKGYVGRTIGIKLRFDDFRTVTRDHTLNLCTADAAVIRREAGLCLKRVHLTRRLRLLGVRVASLERPSLSTPAEHPAPTAEDQAPPTGRARLTTLPRAAQDRPQPKTSTRKAATSDSPTPGGMDPHTRSLFPEDDEPAALPSP
jgi:DNA polymerase IV